MLLIFITNKKLKAISTSYLPLAATCYHLSKKHNLSLFIRVLNRSIATFSVFLFLSLSLLKKIWYLYTAHKYTSTYLGSFHLHILNFSVNHPNKLFRRNQCLHNIQTSRVWLPVTSRWLRAMSAQSPRPLI